MTALSTAAAGMTLLGTAVAGAYERQADGFGAQVAREFRYWLRAATVFFILPILPGFISRPDPDLPAAIHNVLSSLAPLFVTLGLLCLAVSVYKLVPAWRRYQAERERIRQRRQIAETGAGYSEISAEVAESIRQCLPELTVQANVRSDDGHTANLVIDSEAEGQRYVVYALPYEHLHLEARGGAINPNAVRRAAEVARSLDGRPLLWTQQDPSAGARGYYVGHDRDPQPYVVEGKDIHLAEAINKFELAARSERRRREAREASRKAQEDDPRFHIPIRNSMSANQARSQNNRDTWERFNLLAPRHPHIREEVQRRTRNLCDACLNPLPEGEGKVVVTDHNHICRNENTVRIALSDSDQPITQDMPDCGQCHYENPEFYESCLSRLTVVHPHKCPPPPDDPEEAQKEAEHQHRERLARLGKSFSQR